MAGNPQVITVSSQSEFEARLNQHIMQGYQVRRGGPPEVLLCKPRPPLNWALFVVLLLFTCGIGNIIQVIAYLAVSEQWTTITYAGPKSTSPEGVAPAPGVAPPADAGPNVRFNETRSHWFDGQSWHDARVEVPPGAKIDLEKHAWWDGQRWQPLPEQ